MNQHLILGTAGHIDHGKTTLIHALTGINTDRLPEEKRRGITIELGYAHLDLDNVRLGIVDVPGHERFVRQMLAGATGIDLALLVIAADDSIKPQTLEHADILKLLDVRHGVVALTKCDLVESQWLELVETEVAEFLQTTSLPDAPIVRTSAPQGLGIDQLKAELAAAANQALADRNRRSGSGAFSMPIDRVFTLAGHGTVVTGSVSHGTVRVGDELTIEPGGRNVRVRSVQNHDQPVDHASAGQRAAINLAGVHHEEIVRGQQLGTRGYLKPTRLLTVQLKVLESAPRALADRRRIRVHLGTAEVLAVCRLFECKALQPGKEALAQLFLSEPAVAIWNQPFVIRSESPVVTIGGGRVLHPSPSKMRRNAPAEIEMAKLLRSSSPAQRASAVAYFAPPGQWEPADLARTAGADNVDVAIQELRRDGVLVELETSPQRRLQVHRQRIDELSQQVVEALTRLHQQNPLAPGISRAQLEARFTWLNDTSMLHIVLKQLKQSGKIDAIGDLVILDGHGPKLSQNEKRTLAEIVAQIEAAGLQPPTVAELVAGARRARESIPQLVELAVAQGDLVRISREIVLHRTTVEQLTRKLKQLLAGGQARTLSEIRQHLETSRKYAVPLCEYFDQTGLTRRQGDLRVLAQSS